MTWPPGHAECLAEKLIDLQKIWREPIGERITGGDFDRWILRSIVWLARNDPDIWLNLVVDRCLAWFPHFEFDWRNLKACPPKLRETAYFSLVRSSLEYSSAVWDPFRQKDIDKLEKIQRAAARFVTQNYRQTASVTSLIQNLGWTDLKTRRKNSRLFF